MALSIVENTGIFLTMRKHEGLSHEELIERIDRRGGKK
jgi:hypothetical protein